MLGIDPRRPGRATPQINHQSDPDSTVGADTSTYTSGRRHGDHNVHTTSSVGEETGASATGNDVIGEPNIAARRLGVFDAGSDPSITDGSIIHDPAPCENHETVSSRTFGATGSTTGVGASTAKRNNEFQVAADIAARTLGSTAAPSDSALQGKFADVNSNDSEILAKSLRACGSADTQPEGADTTSETSASTEFPVALHATSSRGSKPRRVAAASALVAGHAPTTSKDDGIKDTRRGSTVATDTESHTLSNDTDSRVSLPSVDDFKRKGGAVQRAFANAREKHLAAVDYFHAAGKETCQIARRRYAGDTDTIKYDPEQYQEVKTRWASQMLREGDTWDTIAESRARGEATYMPWDDGTRSKLYRECLGDSKHRFEYDLADLCDTADDSVGWVSNHWKDMTVADVQGSVLALLSDEERKTFYANMDRNCEEQEYDVALWAQRHEQAWNNVYLRLKRKHRQKVHDPALSSLGFKGAMDMYSQVTQMQEAGLFPARPDFTITSPLLRPFQTCTLTQGITPDEMASGMSQSRTLVAPAAREQLSPGDTSRTDGTRSALYSDHRAHMAKVEATDSSDQQATRKYHNSAFEARKRETDPQLRKRIIDDLTPYLGIVADTVGRSQKSWGTGQPMSLNLHGVLHHEILAMADKAWGIPDSLAGSKWHNCQLRPMGWNFKVSGFAGAEGSTLTAEPTWVQNPIYPRKHNLAGVDDLPDVLKEKHDDPERLVKHLMTRMDPWIADELVSVSKRT